MRSAPGRRMFGASACSRPAICRCPASYQTARHRPPSERAGYTVIPHSKAGVAGQGKGTYQCSRNLRNNDIYFDM
jgi:hypothetical protein